MRVHPNSIEAQLKRELKREMDVLRSQQKKVKELTARLKLIRQVEDEEGRVKELKTRLAVRGDDEAFARRARRPGASKNALVYRKH